MADTYEPIATTTLGAGASVITLSSIPSTYTDLRLVAYINGMSASTGNILLYFNTDTNVGTSCSHQSSGVSGGSTYNSTAALQAYASFSIMSLTANVSYLAVDIMNYANTSMYKTFLGTFDNDSNGSGSVNNVIGLWRNTSAINQLRLETGAGITYNTGTMVTLYGIKEA